MSYFSCDMELFAAFNRGEVAAIQKVYHLHLKPLCIFAKRITGEKEVAEDLTADTFIKMLNKREHFQNLANVRSFLYVTVRNSCLNHLKTRKRHAAIQNLVGYPGAEETEAYNVLQVELLRVHILQEVYVEVERLPGRCREIFKLLFIDGLSTEEIGERLGISPQTVRTQKARALGILKHELMKRKLHSTALPCTLFKI